MEAENHTVITENHTVSAENGRKRAAYSSIHNIHLRMVRIRYRKQIIVWRRAKPSHDGWTNDRYTCTTAGSAV